jgi:hypothetical protein
MLLKHNMGGEGGRGWELPEEGKSDFKLKSSVCWQTWRGIDRSFLSWPVAQPGGGCPLSLRGETNLV